jgi:hypothetical protein
MRKQIILLFILVIINTKAENETNRFFVAINTSSDNFLGAKLGYKNIYKEWGLYINGMIGAFNFNLDSDFDTDKIQINSSHYYEYSGIQEKESYTFNIGTSYCFNKSIDFFGGLGYGKYQIINQLYSYKMNDERQNEYWAKKSEYPITGLNIELGTELKVDNVIFQLGTNTIMFKRFAVQVGIGYQF